MKTLHIIIFLTIAFLASCIDKSRTVVKSEYINGNKKLVYIYPNQNDTLNYLREYFNLQGQITTRGFIKDGKEDGKWEWWYDNGTKKDEANFFEGNYFGKRKHWYENGSLKKMEILFDTIPPNTECSNSKNTIYYDNGKLDEEYTYQVDKDLKTGCIYERDGSKIYLSLKSGLRDSSYSEIYPNNKLRIKGYYKDGRQTGKWIWYDTTGNILKRKEY